MRLTDWEVLDRIYATGEERIRLIDLARQFLVTPSSCTRIVDRLEKRGLLARVPSVQDRREILLLMTPAGRKRYLAVRPHILAAIERDFSSFLPGGLVDEMQAVLRNLIAAAQIDAQERQTDRGRKHKLSSKSSPATLRRSL